VPAEENEGQEGRGERSALRTIFILSGDLFSVLRFWVVRGNSSFPVLLRCKSSGRSSRFHLADDSALASHSACNRFPYHRKTAACGLTWCPIRRPNRPECGLPATAHRRQEFPSRAAFRRPPQASCCWRCVRRRLVRREPW